VRDVTCDVTPDVTPGVTPFVAGPFAALPLGGTAALPLFCATVVG
jgi:hypothetical protein